jgi:hypothetical protein
MAGLFLYTGHTQKNGAVLIVNTIKTEPFFCVCPGLLSVLFYRPISLHVKSVTFRVWLPATSK